MPKLSKADQKAQISLTEAARRKEVALAEIRRMEADLKAGKLVEVSKVQEETFKKFRIVREGILALPDRLAPLLATESDEFKIRQTLGQELQSALGRCAEACVR